MVRPIHRKAANRGKRKRQLSPDAAKTTAKGDSPRRLRAYAPKESNWYDRFDEVLQFIKRNKRVPSRGAPETPEEASLGWWLKDQRRKMLHGAEASRKRGCLTDEQAFMMTQAGLAPRQLASRQRARSS